MKNYIKNQLSEKKKTKETQGKKNRPKKSTKSEQLEQKKVAKRRRKGQSSALESRTRKIWLYKLITQINHFAASTEPSTTDCGFWNRRIRSPGSRRRTLPMTATHRHISLIHQYTLSQYHIIIVSQYHSILVSQYNSVMVSQHDRLE